MLDSVREAVDFIADAKNATVPNTGKAKVIEGFEAYLQAIEHEIEERYVELPKDSDGVPIHAGDKLAHKNKPIELDYMRLSKGGWELHEVGRGHNWFLTCAGLTHYHEPTVEGLLWEMLANIGPDADDEDAAPIVESFAARLKLKEDE